MRTQSRQDELTQFKTEINLCEYLAANGYAIDRRKSSRRSVAMKHTNGDKLIVSRSQSKVWIYFNVHGNDNGTIIDFVQRDRITLGEVRKRLRPWLGRPEMAADELPQLPRDLEPSTANHDGVLKAWMKARPIGDSNRYLEVDRKIPASVFSHPKFADRIRVDSRSNVLFGHWGEEGLSGYEVKNRMSNGRSFTGFAPGGTKSLFYSSASEDDHTLMVFETAIDLLSVAAIRGADGHRMLSTGGQVSPLQLELIAKSIDKMPDDASVRLMMDNDEAGRGLAQRIAEFLMERGLPAERIQEDLPTANDADWNDQLRSMGPDGFRLVPPSLGG